MMPSVFTDYTDLEIPFRVKFNRTYDKQLDNKSSEIYNETASNYTKEVSRKFNKRWLKGET